MTSQDEFKEWLAELAPDQKRVTIEISDGFSAEDLDYWYQRAQKISDDFCDGRPVTFTPKEKSPLT